MQKLLLLPLFLFIGFHSMAQQVVVNEYFNAADQRDEWTELLVISDNVDMRGWSIRDNNGSQTSWQPGVTFSNDALWNNLRAGTIIILWHRITSSSNTAHTTDVNKADGYIEINVQNATYFSGGSFGSSPGWAGNSLNVAGGGDVIELLNAGGTHVHALGHMSSPGSNWTALPTPKLNHANSASSGDAIYACPGATLSDYNGPGTGNNFTSKNDITTTFGLPNTCGASANGNTVYTNSLREPSITSQTITPGTALPGDITFSWTAATDANPGDHTTGYMILRNTSNTFTAPSDGTTYTVGSTLGSATVITEINSSATVTYTDNTVTAGNCYYYRVYAFRYGTDNLNGNSFDDSRGRAYNQTNFIFVNCLTVLPIELLSFDAKTLDNKVDVSWSTASETNNDFFTLERSADAINFNSVATIQGAGNSTQLLNYRYTDEAPLDGTSYYRLMQTDFNGTSHVSEMVPVTTGTFSISAVYPNPADDALTIDLHFPQESSVEISVKNMLGITLQVTEFSQKEGDQSCTLHLASIPKGIYLLCIKSGDKLYQNKFIKQ
ncbi:MAG: domain containing protein [Bacteroidetes bacterium]|nr:domain containing protein [Bacteroidota bacterium]